MNRQTAYELLTAYTQKTGLIQHALAVEAAMKGYAVKYGEPVEDWQVVGLLHDFDYEKYPTKEDHPAKGAEILRGHGVDETWIEAILGHADYTGVERKTLMAKALFAVDELCGFIMASALVRPSKSLDDLTSKSVKKKLKDKRFAAAVSRDDIGQGAEELGLDLTEHIDFVIQSLRPIQQSLGLKVIKDGIK